MSSKLFAFQVAKPIESRELDTLSAEYDSESQTLIWQGGTRPQALHCTLVPIGCSGCNGYGDYCITWGGCGPGYVNYACDH